MKDTQTPEEQAKYEEMLKAKAAELKPVKYEFECENGTFVYSFDEMSADRILQAQRLFRIDMELLNNLPSLPSELQIATERQTQRHAYAAMLMKKTAHGFEKYEPATASGFDALASIKGKDFEKLKECQQDFFSNSGLSSEYSSMKSQSMIKSVLKMFKEFKPEQIMAMLPLIEGSMSTEAVMQSAMSSMNTDDITKNLENPSIGQ